MASTKNNVGQSEDTFAQAISLGRYGAAQEVANLVMLLSDEVSYLMGGVYTAGGGSTAS